MRSREPGDLREGPAAGEGHLAHPCSYTGPLTHTSVRENKESFIRVLALPEHPTPQPLRIPVSGTLPVSPPPALSLEPGFVTAGDKSYGARVHLYLEQEPLPPHWPVVPFLTLLDPVHSSKHTAHIWPSLSLTGFSSSISLRPQFGPLSSVFVEGLNFSFSVLISFPGFLSFPRSVLLLYPHHSSIVFVNE